MAFHDNAAADREIERLMALHPKGFDLSLDRITRLLERLGNPQQRLPPVIHIAGTNGKGSAAAFSRALLEAAGYRVHVHTSPHLVNWHERYRLGAPRRRAGWSTTRCCADAIARVAEANGGETITVFEILTAVDLPAVFRASGRCGDHRGRARRPLRRDQCHRATRPSRVIMPISLDHEAYLGDRVELIAAEKAGIIKRGCPVVIGAQESEARADVLVETAERLGCPLFVYGQDFLAYEENGRWSTRTRTA